MSLSATDSLFAAAAVAIAVAQFLILRSTRRGIALAPRRSGSVLEWLYAILPALALAAVLAWTWRTMHPVAVRAGASVSTPGTLS